jgi:hypothetical protein
VDLSTALTQKLIFLELMPSSLFLDVLGGGGAGKELEVIIEHSRLVPCLGKICEQLYD